MFNVCLYTLFLFTEIKKRNFKMSNNILVTRSSMPEFDEYVEEIKEMWDTHWLTNMGPKH